METNSTEVIVAYANDISFDDLPEEVVGKARLLIADNVA
jgi:hypothetical protein